jgi:hypothetical protein
MPSPPASTKQHISGHLEPQNRQMYIGDSVVSSVAFIFQNWTSTISLNLMFLPHKHSLWFNMLPQTAVGENGNSYLWFLYSV